MERAAKKELTTTMRRAILQKLRADGIELQSVA
jgi:hypothetical protein